MHAEIHIEGLATLHARLWDGTMGHLGWNQEDGTRVVAKITPRTDAMQGLKWATAAKVVTCKDMM